MVVGVITAVIAIFTLAKDYEKSRQTTANAASSPLPASTASTSALAVKHVIP